LGVKPEDTAGVGPAAKEGMPLYRSLTYMLLGLRPEIYAQIHTALNVMACLELRRVAVRVCIRIKLVHVVDDECTIASSLEPSIDLVVARHDGFVLWSG
jgi:hypothetical protein